MPRPILREVLQSRFDSFPQKDLDHGLEWCEEQILSMVDLGEVWLPSLRAQLERDGLMPEMSERLEGYLKKVVAQQERP
jgi:hypothetical protein